MWPPRDHSSIHKACTGSGQREHSPKGKCVFSSVVKQSIQTTDKGRPRAQKQMADVLFHHALSGHFYLNGLFHLHYISDYMFLQVLCECESVCNCVCESMCVHVCV